MMIWSCIALAFIRLELAMPAMLVLRAPGAGRQHVAWGVNPRYRSTGRPFFEPLDGGDTVWPGDYSQENVAPFGGLRDEIVADFWSGFGSWG